MDRTFILKRNYEIYDTQMEEVVNGHKNEYEIKEQDLRAEVEKAVREYQHIGDDKEDIYYQYNGDKTWMPATVFYDYIKTASIDDIIKMKFVFLGFIGNSTDFESAEIIIEEKKTQEKIIIIETERIYEFDIYDEVDDEYRRIWSETNIKKKILTEQETREWLKNYINNVDTHTLIYHGEKQPYTRNEFITFVNNATFEIIIDTEYNFHYFYQEDMKQTRTNIKFKKLDN